MSLALGDFIVVEEPVQGHNMYPIDLTIELVAEPFLSRDALIFKYAVRSLLTYLLTEVVA